MVLMGMTPENCLLAAQNGIQFWEAQVSKQFFDQKQATDQIQQELLEMHRNYDTRLTTLSSENATLQEEVRREYTLAKHNNTYFHTCCRMNLQLLLFANCLCHSIFLYHQLVKKLNIERG